MREDNATEDMQYHIYLAQDPLWRLLLRGRGASSLDRGRRRVHTHRRVIAYGCHTGPSAHIRIIILHEIPGVKVLHLSVMLVRMNSSRHLCWNGAVVSRKDGLPGRFIVPGRGGVSHIAILISCRFLERCICRAWGQLLFGCKWRIGGIAKARGN